MLHSQFVPHKLWSHCPKHMVRPQSLCASGNVMIYHCGKSLLHTKLGSQDHVFFAAMLHSQFVPHIVVHIAAKLARSCAMQSNHLCRSHGCTVVNHYCTQNWGLTMCFLRQCCTHMFVPHIVVTMPQNWHKGSWPRPSQFWGTVATMGHKL